MNTACQKTIRVLAVSGGLLVAVSVAHATPSTNFWAPSTPGVQGFGILHLTYDSYFNDRAAYPIDTGLEIGLLPGKAVQAEGGFDLLYPTLASDRAIKAPFVLNAKLGAPEGAYFKGSPAWSAGIFGVGFEKDVTDQDVLDAVVGKTFPVVGSVAAGGYYGLHDKLLRSSSGSDQRAGALAGWFSPSIPTRIVDHLNFTLDVQTGRNVLGATGGGVYVYVTPAVDVLTGPVFFFDRDLQPGRSSWIWTMQLDVDMDSRAHAHR
jgi:hypothetical protein